jgi:hypothetical protein
VILLGALLAVPIGLLLGGHLSALASVRVRFAGLLLVALLLRFGTQALIAQGVDVVDQLRLPLYTTAFLLIAVALWPNRGLPGLLVVLAGALSNGLAIVVNGGWMPVYVPALAVAGLSPSELSPTYHVALPIELNLGFLLHAGPLGDIIPFPAPVIPNVVSIGDVLISVGLRLRAACPSGVGPANVERAEPIARVLAVPSLLAEASDQARPHPLSARGSGGIRG